MTTMDDKAALTKVAKGLHVSKGALAIAGANTKPLFTVTVGRVLVTQILLEVTTIIQAQADATKLISTPTTGTAVDLCATADITGKEAGSMWSITGVASDAMLIPNAGSVPEQLKGVIVPIGSIGINTAANNTGAVKSDIWYFALDEGATIAAV